MSDHLTDCNFLSDIENAISNVFYRGRLLHVITSVEEVMFSSALVCLLVC